MYPTLYHAIKDLFGLDIPFFKLLMTFGFFVAVSFLIAYWVMVQELKRKESEPGMPKPKKVKRTVGGKVPMSEYISTAIFGLVVGWKVPKIITHFDSISQNLQDYLLSIDGYWWGGLLGIAIMVGLRYYEYQKNKLEKPEIKEVVMRPYEHMSEITVQAALFGILGAKIFHILEYPADLISDPIGSIFSFSGLTFLGGLILGGWAVLRVAKKHGIPRLKMLDVGAIGMMLSYATGRMGCHFSGDGDWGTVNLSPKPGWMSSLPDWLWSYNYPNNVLKECNPYTGDDRLDHLCNFSETPYLIDPVWPTPLYEIMMCLALFGVLWAIRKKISWDGGLFGVYLVFAGVERFLIEQIRVNSEYHPFGLSFTQAELLSALMVVGGIAMFFITRKKGSEEGHISGTSSDLD